MNERAPLPQPSPSPVAGAMEAEGAPQRATRFRGGPADGTTETVDSPQSDQVRRGCDFDQEPCSPGLVIPD